jgi:excinuclease UvrABC nuclease subunit
MHSYMDELRAEKRFWLALSVCDGIGPVRFQQLLRHFGSANAAWKASFTELKESGISNKISQDLIYFKKKFSL